MIIVYSVCVLLSFAFCIWFNTTDVRHSPVQNLMLMITPLSSLGYLCIALAVDLREALLAQKIAYIGGCFIPLLYTMTVCEVCGIKIPRRVSTILFAIQSAVFAIICTVGYSTIYYNSVSFEVLNGTGTLIKEYGPLHFLHPLTMFSFFAASIIIAVYACVKKKNVNRKELIRMVLCSAIAIASYPIEKLTHLGYETYPVSYILLMIGALIPIYHSDLYAVTENKDVIYEQLNSVGFITFSRDIRYMGANNYAFQLFTELRSMNLRHRITCPSPALSEIIRDVEAFLSDHHSSDGHRHSCGKSIQINERYYETAIHTLENYLGKCVGATMVLRDITEHMRVLELTERYNEALNREVELKTERIRSIQSNTILGMAQMVESRDLSTGGHIKRTSDVVRLFSGKLLLSDIGFDKHFLDLVIRSAPMHDLGKIGVDDVVLRKQGKFTDEEYEKMKKHAEIGGRMVKDILSGVEEERFVEIAFNVANYHHEKVNGRGYPCGLKGNDIPIEARIMALADVFDALVSKRCYKDAFSYDRAFSIIENDAGEHFDRRLTEIFLSCRAELEDYYDRVDRENA